MQFLLPSFPTNWPGGLGKAGWKEETFGKLEVVSGLVLATKNGEMGAVSSIRLLDHGTKFISVLDTGHWATGAIERDKEGKLTGIADYRITRRLNFAGEAEPR